MKKILMMILMFGVAESRTALVFGTNYSSFNSANDYDEYYVEDFGNNGVDIDEENVMGFRIGIENVSKGLITGLTYSQRGVLLNLDGEIHGEMSVIMEYVTGYALIQIPLGSLNLLAGGEGGYFMSGEFVQDVESYYYNESYYESNDIDPEDWNDLGGSPIDAGLVFGAKFDISPKLSVVGTYYLGLAEWGEDEDDELTTYYGAGDFKHRAFQIYLSYGL